MAKTTFIVAGLNGFFATSKDGKRWKETTGKEGDTYKYVVFGDKKCIVGGSRGGHAIFNCSKNGSKWERSSKDVGYGKSPKMAFYHESKFYTVGGDSTNIAQTKPLMSESSDGLKWTEPKTLSGKKMFKRCATDGKIIVTVGDYGLKAVATSPYEWKQAKDIKVSETLVDIAYGNGVFVGCGLHGMRMSTKDGLSWSKPEIGEEGEHINSIFFDGKQFVGVGLGASYFSQNGKSWKRVPNNDAPYLVTYSNGLYVGAKWKGKVFTSRDAVRWEQVDNLKGAITTIGAGELS